MKKKVSERKTRVRARERGGRRVSQGERGRERERKRWRERKGEREVLNQNQSYIVSSRYEGRVILQEESQHFRVTCFRYMMYWKVIVLRLR